MTRPRCLFCSALIPKKTESVEFWHNAEDAPTSMEECRRRTNHEVVSLRYWPSGKVRSFSTWDGKSFDPRFGHFCKGECAAMFGWRMADRGARL